MRLVQKKQRNRSGKEREGSYRSICYVYVSALNSSSRLPENAIQAFGNGSEVKTGGEAAGTSTPAGAGRSPQLSSSTAGVMLEAELSTRRAQTPAQVRALGHVRGAAQTGGVQAARLTVSVAALRLAALQ